MQCCGIEKGLLPEHGSCPGGSLSCLGSFLKMSTLKKMSVPRVFCTQRGVFRFQTVSSKSSYIRTPPLFTTLQWWNSMAIDSPHVSVLIYPRPRPPPITYRSSASTTALNSPPDLAPCAPLPSPRPTPSAPLRHRAYTLGGLAKFSPPAVPGERSGAWAVLRRPCRSKVATRL